jgi:hypothetical protein
MNTSTVIIRQLMQTARMLEAEWWQVLRGNVSMGAKEDESSTGHVWAAGFHHVMARSHLEHVLKLNPLAPSDPYMGRTAQLTSRPCILTLQRGVTGGARIAKTPYVVE